MSVDRSKWPVMVRIGLWGLPNRGAAWAFVGLSIALAVGCIIYGFIDRRFFCGGVLIVSMSIRMSTRRIRSEIGPILKMFGLKAKHRITRFT